MVLLHGVHIHLETCIVGCWFCRIAWYGWQWWQWFTRRPRQERVSHSAIRQHAMNTDLCLLKANGRNASYYGMGWRIVDKHRLTYSWSFIKFSTTVLVKDASRKDSIVRRKTHWHMSLVARIQMVKADKARAVEDLLLRLAQSNQLRNKVSEQQLIDLLGQINQQEPSASQTRIVVRCISPPQLFLCQYTKMWGVYSTIDVALMMILMMITISNWRRSKDKSHNIHIHIHIPQQSINKAFISNTFTSFFVPRSRVSFWLTSGLDALFDYPNVLHTWKEGKREREYGGRMTDGELQYTWITCWSVFCCCALTRERDLQQMAICFTLVRYMHRWTIQACAFHRAEWD